MPASWRCAICARMWYNAQLRDCPQCKQSRVAWFCGQCGTKNDDPKRTTCYWCKKDRTTLRAHKPTLGIKKSRPTSILPVPEQKQIEDLNRSESPRVLPTSDISTRVSISGLAQIWVDVQELAESLGDLLYAHGCEVRDVVIELRKDGRTCSGNATATFADGDSVEKALRLDGQSDSAAIDPVQRPHGRLRLNGAMKITRAGLHALALQPVKLLAERGIGDGHDQTSTTAPSPRSNHDESVCESATIGVSRLQLILQNLQQARCAPQRSEHEISDLVRDAVAEYNKEMHGSGWEVSDNMQGWVTQKAASEQERSGHVDNRKKPLSKRQYRKLDAGQLSEQERSGHAVAGNIEMGVSKKPIQTWASRLLQIQPTHPAHCKPQVAQYQKISISKQRPIGLAPRQVQKHADPKECQTRISDNNLRLAQNQLAHPARSKIRDVQHQKFPISKQQTSAPAPVQVQKNADLKDCQPKISDSNIRQAQNQATKRENRALQTSTVERHANKINPTKLPALRSGEIQFILDTPLSLVPTRSTCSPSLSVGKFRFKILVFPRGTKQQAGRHLSVFVLAEPGDVEPDSVFKNVKFEITVVNWTDFSRSKVKSESFSFKASGRDIDRGWHDLLAVDSMKSLESDWVGPEGELCVRARCQLSSPHQGWE